MIFGTSFLSRRLVVVLFAVHDAGDLLDEHASFFFNGIIRVHKKYLLQRNARETTVA